MSKSLLPINATKPEKDIEASIERISDIPVPIKDLWNPQTCPEKLLPWLAWALSVDVWDSSWTTEIKRNVIAQSVSIHRIKGTVEAVEQALLTLGVQAELSEWFEHGGIPHTFYLTAWANSNLVDENEPILNPWLYQTLKKTIDQVKPVRSHYDFRVGAAMNSDLGIGCSASIVTSQRFSCDLIFTPGLRPTHVGIGSHITGKTYLRISMETQ